MKDQIIISKENGNCAVAVPLFRICDDDTLDEVEGYVITFNSLKPIAYAVDVGEQVTLMNAEFLQDKVEWVGDL
jgi:hypothetical protein